MHVTFSTLGMINLNLSLIIHSGKCQAEPFFFFFAFNPILRLAVVVKVRKRE